MTNPVLGTCYYPEHWPRSLWQEDARRMADLGLTWVRIGEFAWSRVEPEEGRFEFDWLDEAIGILGEAGLRVVLGTPTATPPRWVVTKYPDMLAIDANGQPRGFGSRRHYCFSHQGYIAQCRDIVMRLAQRYGSHPDVGAWQTDNEYGCHNTTLSYSDAARGGFRRWLRAAYTPEGANDGDIVALNAAWGNVFWSMEYSDFDEIDLPNLTVTEANPAHHMAFRRYSSEQVAHFNRAQVEIIRAHSDRPIAHNYMGRVTEFDHYDVGADLDIASWDSYPLGFLEQKLSSQGEDHRNTFMRQGDPDFQAFHHDLYRSVGRGRLWIMEQQPGPVNWADYNPAPLPGMVRLWTWEAIAHGAECVSYFRWRQAPFAQELMHAGLLRPDSAEAPAFAEARQVAEELKNFDECGQMRADVALVFDYEAHWAWEIQPHGKGLSYFDLIMEHYRALRLLGLNVDIVPPKAEALGGYALILAPGLIHANAEMAEALTSTKAQVILGPRSLSRTADLSTPLPLPPDIAGMDIKVARSESLRPGAQIALETGGFAGKFKEDLEGRATPSITDKDGGTIAAQSGNITYVGAWLDPEALRGLLTSRCAAAGITTFDFDPRLRRRDTREAVFWFNYTTAELLSSDGPIPPADFLRVSKA